MSGNYYVSILFQGMLSIFREIIFMKKLFSILTTIMALSISTSLYAAAPSYVDQLQQQINQLQKQTTAQLQNLQQQLDKNNNSQAAQLQQQIQQVQQQNLANANSLQAQMKQLQQTLQSEIDKLQKEIQDLTNKVH